MNTFSIKTDESGEVTIFNGSKLAAQMIDLTDLGMGIVPHKLNTLSEMQALEIIFELGYKTIAEKMMAEIVAEEAYINNATKEELKEVLGSGRAKKGIFEGDIIDGELEIGQVSSIINKMQTAAEVIDEIISEFNAEKTNLVDIDFQ